LKCIDIRPLARIPAGLRGKRLERCHAPRNTPAPVVEKLNSEITPRSLIQSGGAACRIGRGARFPVPGQLFEISSPPRRKEGKVVQAANIKAE